MAKGGQKFTFGEQSFTIEDKVYRKAIGLLKKGLKVDAVLAVRNEAKLDMKASKLIVDQIESQINDEASIDHESLSFMDSLKAVFAGQLAFGRWVHVHQQKLVVTVFAVWLATLALIGLTSMPSTADAAPQTAWFYDLNTGELFSAQYQVPPIPTPTGEHEGEDAGVMAYVFTCGSCSADDRYIGWIETYGDAKLSMMSLEKDKELMKKAPMLIQAASGQMIRRVSDDKWVPIESEEAQVIMEESQNQCGDREPVQCSAP